jgi:hypothetical protein
MPQELKFDFESLKRSAWVGQLTKHLNEYEKVVRKWMRQLDTKSQKARGQGIKKLDKLSAHIAKTRVELEKRITSLVQTETKRLNRGVQEFLDYARMVAKAESKTSGTASKAKARGVNRGKTVSKKAPKKITVATEAVTAPTQASLFQEPTPASSTTSAESGQ